VDDLLAFDDAAQWAGWLAAHHEEPGGAWVRVTKKGAARPTLTSAEAGDVAICYGWIDSVRRSIDAESFAQRYSRRRARSPWSKVNVDRAEALAAAGRMRAPGQAEIDAAKADGRWAAAYESQANATVPPDVEAALAADPTVADRFARLGRTERYLLILPLLKARTPAARAARLRTMIDGLGPEL
jgi:uncharacterized protein YdeI (YjbR/CyaY-like superfamily)